MCCAEDYRVEVPPPDALAALTTCMFDMLWSLCAHAGDYGSMVNERVGAGNWESSTELGDTWAARNAFSYGECSSEAEGRHRRAGVFDKERNGRGCTILSAQHAGYMVGFLPKGVNVGSFLQFLAKGVYVGSYLYFLAKGVYVGSYLYFLFKGVCMGSYLHATI